MEMTSALTVTPHPLTLADQKHIAYELVPGETLGEFLRRHVDNMDSGAWVVTIGGYEVPAMLWNKTFPKHGTVIECRSVVQKQAIALIAVVAIAYFAPYLAGGAYSALGGTYVAANAGLIVGAMSAAITIAGSLIINKVLGPKQIDGGSMRDSDASSTYKIGGGRNRARPYEPIGLLFGELRVTPDYASNPYTWFWSEDQYLYSVFHAGINCNQVTDLRIGQTPLSNYTDIETQTAGLNGMPDQLLQAWSNVDAIAGAQLVAREFVAVKGNPDLGIPDVMGIESNWVSRTSSTNTVYLQADFEGALYRVNDKGNTVSEFMWITGEYRNTSSGSWTSFFPTGSQYIENRTTKPLRLTYGVAVPKGQYEVRFRKITVDSTETSRASSLSWSQLKSVQYDTGDYGGMGRVGMKIKGSGQLNGAIDELNWLATARPMDYWNGSAWATATTRANGLSNPGAQILRFARGIYGSNGKLLAGLGLQDSMIDIESLKGFMVRCAAKGFTFDYYLDAAMSCGDVLEAIAAVGLGSITWQSGKLGVVWAAEDQPIEGVVNMATMKAKTFSVSYQTLDTADSLEYAYYDRERDYSWQTLRVTDPSIGTALSPARLTSIGVTSQAHAAVLARFHLAQSIYQRKDITYDTDLEHLTYKRMSVLALTHDVTQWGYGGRLDAVVNNGGILTLTLDDEVPAGSGPRYIGLRVPGEVGYRVFSVNSFAGASRTITLSTAWPGGVPVPGASAGNPCCDTIWIYDFKATPGYKVRVTGIQPQAGMMGATVSVVPESAEFWNYVLNGSYTPPANQSLLSRERPSATGLQVTEELQRQGNTYFTELTATFTPGGNYDHAQVWVAEGGAAFKMIGETRTNRFTWRTNATGFLSVEVRPFDALGRVGETAASPYTVAGLTTPPPNVASVTFSDPVISWSPVVTPDLAGYVVRFNIGNSGDPSFLTPMHEGLITETSFRVPNIAQSDITIFVYAVDTSGNMSLVPAVIYANLLPPSVETFSITNGALSWSPVVASDLAGYRIRFQYGENPVWSNAGALHDGIVTQSPFKPELIPNGVCTLLIKAVDVSGNESQNAATILANLGDVIVDNVILTYDDKAAGFPGTKTNCAVVDGNLLANDTGSLYWLDDDAPHYGSVVLNYWGVVSYAPLEYVTQFITQQDQIGSRLTLSTVVGTDGTIYWGADGATYFGADPLGYWVAPISYGIEFRYGTQGVFWGADGNRFFPTEDTALVWQTPTVWQPWPGAIENVGDASIDFRITTQGGEQRGGIYDLTVQFDVPDEYEELNDISISAAGTRLPLTKSFRSVKNIQLTLQDNGGTAVTTKYADKATTGPLIYCYNAAGSRVAGIIDARVQGVQG